MNELRIGKMDFFFFFSFFIYKKCHKSNVRYGFIWLNQNLNGIILEMRCIHRQEINNGQIGNWINIEINKKIEEKLIKKK